MARCSELPTQLERDTMNNSHTLYSPSTKSKVWVLFVDAPFIYTKIDGQQAKKKREIMMCTVMALTGLLLEIHVKLLLIIFKIFFDSCRLL